MKILIVFVFLLILYSLGSALFSLLKDKPDRSERMVKALTWRISLSIGLFLLIMIGFALGLIQPHGI